MRLGQGSLLPPFRLWRKLFQSDQAFHEFPWASPVSNPFLNEDPLSVTEVRPIFMLQTIPNANPLLHGGNAEFYGLQARLALNEQFSVVINKLGFVSLHPDDTTTYAKSTGFAELWIGPKWTFFRSPNSGTAIATGLTFQIPVGDGKVVQNTGDLTLDPYISFGQNISLKSFGSLNFLSTTGLAFCRR